MISNGVCVCTPTYYPTQTGCLPCIANSEYDSNQGRCVCKTGYVSSGGSCIPGQNCPHNSQWSVSSGRCVCNSPLQYVINGYCQPCPINSAFNGNECVCNQGYVKNSTTGLCDKTCINATWSGTSCVCWTGYFIINGVCQKCDVNSVYSNLQLTCVCVDGYYGTWNQCNKCHTSCKTCSSGTSTSCTSCHIGSVNNGACSNTCGTGQFRNTNNQCQNCIANCDVCHTSTSCTTCAVGYTKTTNNVGGVTVFSCDLPSPTASYVIALRERALRTGIIYQGVSMTALPVPILTDNCAQCNSLFQVDVNSPFTAISVTQEYVANSQYWFLIIFSFPNSNTPVPTFEYTLKINPTHPYTSYFTAQDLAQLLSGSFSPSAFPTSQTAPVTQAAVATRQIRSFGIRPRTAAGASTASTNDNGINQALINEIFGG